MEEKSKDIGGFSPDLSGVMALIRRLRGEGGCPWDQEQTVASMTGCLTEEMYELLDAISENDIDGVGEEMGDTLFQLLFILVLYQEKEALDTDDVFVPLLRKMIRRHPHVFGDATASTSDAVKKQWDRIKQTEKEGSVLGGIPKTMPALSRAYKVSERAARHNFDWDDIAGVVAKVREEWSEFSEVMDAGDQEAVEMEFGDLLFTLTNVARFNGIDPEKALHASTGKFEARYRQMETIARKNGTTLTNMPRDAVEVLWQDVKRMEVDLS